MNLTKEQRAEKYASWCPATLEGHIDRRERINKINEAEIDRMREGQALRAAREAGR